MNTEFLAETADPPPATVAGLLLFGADPHRYLPHTAIDAAVFSGAEK